MKKNILILLLLFSFTSCFWDKSETESVVDIKRELLQTWNTQDIATWIVDETSTWATIDESMEDKPYKIEYTTEDKFLELDSLDWKELSYWEIEITWKTLDKVDKIEVKFSNKDSSFPVDNFTLKKFKPWDDTFKYYASSKYKVLDYWENIYEFTAYSWDKVSTLKLTIFIKQTENSETKTSLEDNSETNSWSKMDDKTSLEKISTWSSLSGSTTCADLNDYLLEKMSTWYYWNTCREDSNGTNFYLVRLDWKNYVYEKYNVSNNWEVSIKELERWTSNQDTKDTIESRNDELKLRNSEFESKTN